ncbi:MAG: CDC27 family protein, partial [Bryobacteraceae bacterium]
MGHIGRFGCIAILACATLAGESAGNRFDRYRETVDRCRFLVNESRTREAEHSCREAVKLADRLPSAAKRERIDANSLTAQVYLDLGLPEDAFSFANPALKLAQTNLPGTDTLRGTVRYELARCYEGLGRLEEAQE